MNEGGQSLGYGSDGGGTQFRVHRAENTQKALC